MFVSGSRYAKLTSPVTKMVPSGTSTPQRFDGWNTPAKLEATPRGFLLPGYVRARSTGAAVWMPK